MSDWRYVQLKRIAARHIRTAALFRDGTRRDREDWAFFMARAAACRRKLLAAGRRAA